MFFIVEQESTVWSSSFILVHRYNIPYQRRLNLRALPLTLHDITHSKYSRNPLRGNGTISETSYMKALSYLAEILHIVLVELPAYR